MLFKPSPRTITMIKRGSWLFFPLWPGAVAYIWLSAEGMVPRGWNQIFFPAFSVLFVLNFIYALVALNSARQDTKRSQHPDPHVAALIDGEIDIAEYGRRKAQASASSTPPVHEAPIDTQGHTR